MKGNPMRIYADTSVFGGVFDDEFATPSRAFFERVRRKRFELVLSPVVAGEIVDAPAAVRRLFDEIIQVAEVTPVSEAAIRLQEAYIDAGIVRPKHSTDALHVAQATVAGCLVIVSWNFKHIVHFAKIPLYNAVNVLQGYGAIAIHSPQEVVDDEEEV
jgi:predicted nucleic acid-binding protein